MAALPYMQFYVADYLADTTHLSTEEHGAYMLLMMNYWQRGKPLKDCNERLANVARLSNERWISVRNTLEEFFTIENGEWVHKRLERDLKAVKIKCENASKAGKASAAKRSEQSLNECSTGKKKSFNHTEERIKEERIKEEKREENASKMLANNTTTFSLNENHIKICQIKNLDVELELKKFLEHRQANKKSTTPLDFENWLTRAFAQQNQSPLKRKITSEHKAFMLRNEIKSIVDRIAELKTKGIKEDMIKPFENDLEIKNKKLAELEP